MNDNKPSDDFYKIYLMNKSNYIKLKLNPHSQTGGKKSKNNLSDTNIFLNKEYFGMHHNIDHRVRRLHDFNQIINKLKSHLIPKSKMEIDQTLLKKYIKLHKKENRTLVKTIIDQVQYITFKEFKKQTMVQISRFNSYCKQNGIKKYVYVLYIFTFLK